MVGIAAIAFTGIFFFGVPFPIIIIGAALIGYFGGRIGNPTFAVGGGHGSSGKEFLTDADSALGEGIPEHARPTTAWALKISAVFLGLWIVPVLLIVVMLGSENVLSQIAIFFSKMAMVTFGGAYAVLAYVAQQAVDTFGWLRAGELLDGLGMAETTPGPLIMVTQFVGFMAAFRDPGTLSPLMAGTLAGILTTWVTFVPCFLWIFLGAPYVEALRENNALSAALGTITAAVVGVVLNLAVWFALHVLFRELTPVSWGWLTAELPVLSSINLPSFLLTLGALVAVFWFRINVIAVLTTCAAVGIVFYLITGQAV
jgi:chromate transporter